MKEFIKNVIPKIKVHGFELEELPKIYNQPLVLIDESETFVKLIFQSNENLIVSKNGNVSNGKWELIPSANSILLEINGDTKLYTNEFIDEGVMILKLDGLSNDFFILANQNLISDLDAERYLKSKYTEGNLGNIELSHKKLNTYIERVDIESEDILQYENNWNEIENNRTKDLTEKLEIRDNSKRAKILLITFSILIGLTVIEIFSDFFELELLKSIQLGEIVDEKDLDANDYRQWIIAIMVIGINIASVIVFLSWFKRAYGNLHRLGLKNLQYKESMAVWSWFIPFANLVWPVEIMSDIWTKSQEQIKGYDASFLIKSGGLLIGVWWTLFIVSNLFSNYFFNFAFKQNTMEQLIDSSQTTITYGIIQIIEALLVILIVFKISKIELKLAKEVEKSGGKVTHR